MTSKFLQMDVRCQGVIFKFKQEKESAGDLDGDLLLGKLLVAVVLLAFIRPALQVMLLITITSQPSKSVL